MGSNVISRALKGTATQEIWPGYPGARTRTVSDGATTNTSTTVTSATAAFDSGDVGAAIAGTGIPANATIASVTNATTVVISAAATATATGVTLTITKAVPTNGPGLTTPGESTYYGFSIRETTGSGVALVTIRDGSATGTVLDEIGLVSAGSSREWYGPQGIRVPSGMLYVATTGAIEGSLRVS